MDLCNFLWSGLLCKIKKCVERQKWFSDEHFSITTGRCLNCHALQESKIFDHANKKLKSSKENLTDLTQEYKKKKQWQKESAKSSEKHTA